MPKASKVRAKMHCGFVEETKDKDGNVLRKNAHFHAVYSEEGENADYAEATPYANIVLQIDASTPAIDFFEAGEEYYLDFTPVKEA